MQPVNQRRCADGRLVELLPGHGRADDREDARADDRADAERRQRPRPEALLERVVRLFRLADELVDRFAGKQLAGQVQFSSQPLGTGSPIGLLSQNTVHLDGEEQLSAISRQLSVLVLKLAPSLRFGFARWNSRRRVLELWLSLWAMSNIEAAMKLKAGG